MWLALIPSKVTSIDKDFFQRNDILINTTLRKPPLCFEPSGFTQGRNLKLLFKIMYINIWRWSNWPKHVACIVDYNLIGVSESNREIVIKLNCYLSLPTDFIEKI